MNKECIMKRDLVLLAAACCSVFAGTAEAKKKNTLASHGASEFENGKQELGEEQSNPNLIVILADDMGIGDIGAFRELYLGEPKGSPQYAHQFTPNLDRLAKAGIRCTRTYSAAWCAPSRQMLLSGQWSSRRDAYDHPWMGKQLRDAGYVTGLFGKSHGKNPTAKVYGNTNPQTAEFDDGLFFNHGARGFYMSEGETLPGRIGLKPFEFTAEAGDYITEVFTDHAVDFIERHADKPFMLYLPYTAPHEPLHGKPEDLKKLFPEQFAGRSDAEIVAEADGSKFRRLSDEMKAFHYAAMVYNMDLGIGRILQTLEKLGLDENTLILFTADNGAQWGSNYPGTGHKSNLVDGGIRVPFIAWSAEIEKSKAGGSIYNGLMSLADIAPTLVGAAGVKEYPFPTDGSNMLPYWTGEKTPPTGRTFFWSDCGNANSDKLTDIRAFSDEPLEGHTLSQSVYVKDDQKVMCYSLVGTGKTGAVYAKIPDVVGKENPEELVKERYPVAGQLPVEGPGRELFDEMLEMIRESNGGVVPNWSGAPSRDKHNNWWFIK